MLKQRALKILGPFSLALLLDVTACQRSESYKAASSQDTGVSKPIPKPSISPEDQFKRQAEQIATAAFEKCYTKCGDSYYDEQDGLGLGAKILNEYRGPEVEIHPSDLSEADRLNGIQWKGEVEFRFRVERYYKDYKKRYGKAMGWSAWGDIYHHLPYGCDISLRQQGWDHNCGCKDYKAPASIDCASLPK